MKYYVYYRYKGFDPDRWVAWTEWRIVQRFGKYSEYNEDVAYDVAEAFKCIGTDATVTNREPVYYKDDLRGDYEKGNFSKMYAMKLIREEGSSLIGIMDTKRFFDDGAMLPMTIVQYDRIKKLFLNNANNKRSE
jgi:hypothetical protein